MTQESPRLRIAIMGGGAVGCYFGGMLARSGVPVTLIGRAPHVEAMTRQGLHLESKQFQEVVRVSASTDPDAARAAQIVLFCVKTLDTEDAARSLAPHLAKDALVISLQNGVDNVERLRGAGIDAVAAAVYVAAEMASPGHVKHSGRGDLILGDLPGRTTRGDRRRRLEDVAAMFVSAGVPCQVSENIAGELWTKLIMNCAYNAISALSRARYGRIVAQPSTRALMKQIVDEVVAVAHSCGVGFPDVDLLAAVYKLGEAMANALSSTAQDLARGKRTEIDSLNGYVARRGAELGVATPVNQTLFALVKLLEETLASGGGA